MTSSLYRWKLRPREGKRLARSRTLKAGAPTLGSQGAQASGVWGWILLPPSASHHICNKPGEDLRRTGNQWAGWLTDRKVVSGSVKFADPRGRMWKAATSRVFLPTPVLGFARKPGPVKAVTLWAVGGGGNPRYSTLNFL